MVKRNTELYGWALLQHLVKTKAQFIVMTTIRPFM